jgi:hypothetical protein
MKPLLNHSWSVNQSPDAGAVTAMMNLVATLADGHTYLTGWPWLRWLPVGLVALNDGVFVSATRPETAALAGQRVVTLRQQGWANRPGQRPNFLGNVTRHQSALIGLQLYYPTRVSNRVPGMPSERVPARVVRRNSQQFFATADPALDAALA